jgi:hypothetical protein
MTQGVCGGQPSVRAASPAQPDEVGASRGSVYHPLNHREPHTAAALGRYSARELAPRIAPMGGERTPGLGGYRITRVAGTCLAASEHRMAAMREAQGRT